jgi:hypothetical protein
MRAGRDLRRPATMVTPSTVRPGTAWARSAGSSSSAGTGSCSTTSSRSFRDKTPTGSGAAKVSWGRGLNP